MSGLEEYRRSQRERWQREQAAASASAHPPRPPEGDARPRPRHEEASSGGVPSSESMSTSPPPMNDDERHKQEEASVALARRLMQEEAQEARSRATQRDDLARRDAEFARRLQQRVDDGSYLSPTTQARGDGVREIRQPPPLRRDGDDDVDPAPEHHPNRTERLIPGSGDTDVRQFDLLDVDRMMMNDDDDVDTRDPFQRVLPGDLAGFFGMGGGGRRRPPQHQRHRSGGDPTPAVRGYPPAEFWGRGPLTSGTGTGTGTGTGSTRTTQTIDGPDGTRTVVTTSTRTGDSGQVHTTTTTRRGAGATTTTTTSTPPIPRAQTRSAGPTSASASASAGGRGGRGGDGDPFRVVRGSGGTRGTRGARRQDAFDRSRRADAMREQQRRVMDPFAEIFNRDRRRRRDRDRAAAAAAGGGGGLFGSEFFGGGRHRGGGGRGVDDMFGRFFADRLGPMGVPTGRMFGRRGGRGGGRGGESYEDLLRLGERIGQARNRGATSGQIDANSLNFVVKDVEKDVPKDNKSCTICLSDFEAEDKCRRLPCMHCFHTACIDHWLKQNAICPICREKIQQTS